MKLLHLFLFVATIVIRVEALHGSELATTSGRPIYQDDFDTDLAQWRIEQAPGGTVKLENGKLLIDDQSGCTVWFKTKLSGPVMIEYEATMVSEGGKNDRVSDLNCFWMATDPKHPENLFLNKDRSGKFGNYHSLRLYYVGYGANNNTTTRFRRYPGDGTRPCLPGHDLRAKKFLHSPNRTVKIRIICEGSRVSYLRDGETVFEFNDPDPLTEGWFGFRTVKNHMTLDNFRVYRLGPQG